MATKKNTAVGQIDPAPSPAPATGSITLPEMPPAETFVGLVAYGVDTTANESRHIPLEFLGRGVQACIDATAACVEATENLTADVSALVLTDENKPRIQELAGDLPALASGRTPAKVRGVDDQGHSVNLTPAQIAAMAGIDYSLLTEQVVPGVFLPDINGVKRRAYVQTFKATTATALPGSVTLKSGNIASFQVLQAMVKRTDANAFVAPNTVTSYGDGKSMLYGIDLYLGKLSLGVFGLSILNQPYIVTVMFSKITD